MTTFNRRFHGKMVEWESLSVADFKAALDKFPDDMPVLFTWESILKCPDDKCFEVRQPATTHFDRDVLIIDCEMYGRG